MGDAADYREIIALEERDSSVVRHLSADERSKLLVAACRDADMIEKSRRAMGLPAAKPDPWPESTWRILAEAMSRVRNG